MIVEDEGPALLNVGRTGTSVGQVGRTRGGREGNQSPTLWDQGYAEPAGQAFSVGFYQTEPGGWERDGCNHIETLADPGLARVESGRSSESELRFKRIYNAGFQWERQVGGRFIPSIRSLHTNSEDQYYFRGIFSFTSSWGSSPLHGSVVGLQSFSTSSGHEEVFYRVCAVCRWDSAVFPVHCPSFWLVPFRLLVLSFGREILDVCEDEDVVPCFIVCGRFRYCPLYGESSNGGRLCPGFKKVRLTTQTIWSNEASDQRLLGYWQPDYPSLGLYDRYGEGSIWSSGGQGSPGREHGQEASHTSPEESPSGPEERARVVDWQSAELTPGSARHSFQTSRTLRLPIVKLFGPSGHIQYWPPVGTTREGYSVTPRHEGPAILEGSRINHDTPTDLGTCRDSDHDDAHRCIDAGLRGHNRQGPIGRWQQRVFRSTRLLGSGVPRISAHNDSRINDRSAIIRRVYGTLRNQPRRNHPALHRQPSGSTSDYRNVFKISETYGRASETTRIFERSRRTPTNGIPAVGLESVCGPSVPTTQVQRLFTANTRNTGTLVGRRQRARFQTPMDTFIPSTTTTRANAASPQKNRARPVSRVAAHTSLASPTLAPRIGSSGHQGADNTAESVVISQAVGGNTSRVRDREPPRDGTDFITTHFDNNNLSLGRDGLANVFQFFMISRPTMTANMRWDHVTFLSASKIRITIQRLAVGRKNKNMPTKLVERSIDPEVDARFHPITLLQRYRQAVDAYRRQFQKPFPIGVWELPNRARAADPAFTSADMATWLTTSLAKVDATLTTGIRVTPRSHRSGAATAALKLRVDDAQISHTADWELTGKTLRSTYYRPNLTCPLPLARIYFADLL